MPDPINRYMQWPLNASLDDVFTSETGSTWVYDGCGWVSTCCAPVVPCVPEINGISVIYANKGENGLNESFGVSYFTWNSNLDRYEGYLLEGPAIIYWTGLQWRFKFSNNTNTVATSPTSDILDAVWNMLAPFDGKFSIEQIECGLIYNQLCLSTEQGIPFGASPRGPFTLYPSGYASIADIMNGVQSIRYYGEDSNGNGVSLYYDSIDAVWYMSDDYGNDWEITVPPNQNALLLGSPFIDQNNNTEANFDQGICETECYPERDGVTVIYEDGSGFTPIYLTWNPAVGGYYADNQYINELWGWNWIKVGLNGSTGRLEISIDTGGGSQVAAENNYPGSFSTTLFNGSWDGPFNVKCGDVGCTRICAIFNGNATTMVPYGYPTEKALIQCDNKAFQGWIGWNGTDEVIKLNWDVVNGYTLDIDGNGLQSMGVNSYTTAALIAASPYTYNQNGVTGTLTLTLGDC